VEEIKFKAPGNKSKKIIRELKIIVVTNQQGLEHKY
jgi:hypothetical protein